ncbi:MAG: S8 family serine peptidase, partial [bacterium]
MFKNFIVIILLFINITFLLGQVPPDDDMYDDQWNLDTLKMEEAWNVTTCGSTIKIAIIGNGVETNHMDIRDNIIQGYNAMDNSYDANPSGINYYHETAVAGIAGATTNNNRGIAGIAYNCKIMPILMINAGHGVQAEPDTLAKAINWAVNNEADVINLSWAMKTTQNLTDAINNAVTNGRGGKGCVFVTCAGNDGDVDYPATLSNVIAVGMTNKSDE